MAEFSYCAAEVLHSLGQGSIERISPRGAIMLNPHPQLMPVAYESLRKNPQHWSQALAFCLPKELAQRSSRKVLTELGPDKEALRPSDHEELLFDLGLGQTFFDVCIRTSDSALIKQLRKACGRMLMDLTGAKSGINPSKTSQRTSNNNIMNVIAKAGPTQVYITNLGRTEIYQAIDGEQSLSGPASFISAKLLAGGRVSFANTPIPSNYLPMLTLHPENPCIDQLGNEHVFSESAFIRFQTLLQQWGDSETTAQKQLTWNALAQQVQPHEFDNGQNRTQRTATRIALRQYQHRHFQQDQSHPPKDAELIRQWREAFDLPLV